MTDDLRFTPPPPPPEHPMHIRFIIDVDVERGEVIIDHKFDDEPA